MNSEDNMTKPNKMLSKPFLTAPIDNRSGGSLEITVLHTNTGATLKAVETAAHLAKDLAADIRLLVLQVVPYPLSLDTPDVSLEFTQKAFSEMASRLNVELRVEIRIGRDKGVMLESAIKPGSIIFIGGRFGWWPFPESRVARRLGCSVIRQ
jgi:hypothetical protein